MAGQKRLCGAVAAGILFAHGHAVAVAEGSGPARVVSINLCTDQLALQLSAPGQVVSVSRLAVDPALSNTVEQARGLPLNRGTAEEVIGLAPDLVLAGSYSTPHTNQLLARLGYRVERFAPPSSLAEVRGNLHRLGDLLGVPEVAAREIARIDAAVDRAQSQASRFEGRPVFATYDVNGWTAGEGSLIAELAAIAGFDTLGSRLGFVGMGQVPLEALLVYRPDLIDLGDDYRDPPSRGTLALQHPALQALLRQSRRIELPGRQTACGTADLAATLDALTAARAQLDARS